MERKNIFRIPVTDCTFKMLFATDTLNISTDHPSSDIIPTSPNSTPYREPAAGFAG